jgi:hypothetical protein
LVALFTLSYGSMWFERRSVSFHKYVALAACIAMNPNPRCKW